VGDDGAVGQVELPFRPPRPLTQGGEEPHRDPHPPKGIRLVAGRVEARAAALYPPPGGSPGGWDALETRRSVQPCRRRRSGQPGLLYPARVAATDRERSTESGIPIKPVYRAADAPEERPAPAEYPYTRGVRPDGYRERPWTMRQYAGFSSAEETNSRFRLLLDRGQTGLSVAFDLPTQLGLDSDHPLARGEVGRTGVAIDSIEDMRLLMAGIPLGDVSTSMTINAPGSLLLLLYELVAEEQGVAAARLSGTIQNDILKEYIARGNYIFPARPSMRLTVDTFRYCTERLPRWNTISISGYHIREAGSTA